MSDSTRCTRYDTAEVWSGWSSHSSVVAAASHGAEAANRPPRRSLANVRRSTPKSASAAAK